MFAAVLLATLGRIVKLKLMNAKQGHAKMEEVAL